MANRVAVLLDGGYVRVRLERSLRRFPDPADVMSFTEQIQLHPRLAGSELLRVYYDDAPPIGGSKPNPLSRRAYDFEANPERALNQKLQAGLASTADVAVRRGEVVFRGWRVRQATLNELSRSPRAMVPEDLVPDVVQKGVDLRIGLDVAWLAVMRMVDVIVLVAGDSDFVPAMKFARREGLRVYLHTMGLSVRPNMIEHADFVLGTPLRAPP